MTTSLAVDTRRIMLNKVPEVTVYFWIIKILCTTVGESFADYINETLGVGLTNTTLIFSAALIAVGIAQFRVRRADQRRRHVAHRQPHRRAQRPAVDQHHRLLRAAGCRLRRLVRPRAHPL